MKHLLVFKPRDIIADLDLNMVENMMNPTKDMVSVFHNEKMLCVAGINHLRTGVVEAWLISSNEINNCKFTFYKTMKRLIDFCFETMGIHRLEIAVDCNWMEGDKWARSLGLKYESITRSYDFNHRDHAIYVRIE